GRCWLCRWARRARRRPARKGCAPSAWRRALWDSGTGRGNGLRLDGAPSHCGSSARARGDGPVGDHLHEGAHRGLKAAATLPGVGATEPFDYSKGGKQGGVETPEESNAVVDHALEPLVCSWAVRGMSFRLDLPEGAQYFSHAVWADNGFLFASGPAMMQAMLAEVAAAVNARRLPSKCWLGALSWMRSCLPSRCCSRVLS
ncbi:unnamed protein product, partial [Prorocentrum cordatum]